MPFIKKTIAHSIMSIIRVTWQTLTLYHNIQHIKYVHNVSNKLFIHFIIQTLEI